MTKQEKFLWVVQTVTLANAVNMATCEPPPPTAQQRAIYSATATWAVAQEAIIFSEKIPERLSAEDAAHQFLTLHLTNWREAAEREEGFEHPRWLLRG